MFLLLVLLSAHITRFSVSGMHTFFSHYIQQTQAEHGIIGKLSYFGFSFFYIITESDYCVHEWYLSINPWMNFWGSLMSQFQQSSNIKVFGQQIGWSILTKQTWCEAVQLHYVKWISHHKLFSVKKLMHKGDQ